MKGCQKEYSSPKKLTSENNRLKYRSFNSCLGSQNSQGSNVFFKNRSGGIICLVENLVKPREPVWDKEVWPEAEWHVHSVVLRWWQPRLSAPIWVPVECSGYVRKTISASAFVKHINLSGGAKLRRLIPLHRKNFPSSPFFSQKTGPFSPSVPNFRN